MSERAESVINPCVDEAFPGDIGTALAGVDEWFVGSTDASAGIVQICRSGIRNGSFGQYGTMSLRKAELSAEVAKRFSMQGYEGVVQHPLPCHSTSSLSR